MGEKSEIEWTDATFNPWIGCQKVSPGCDFCYAEALVARYGLLGASWGPQGKRIRTSSPWLMPKRLQKRATNFFAEHGRRQRVFTASLADVFDNKAPAGARADLWALIKECPNLDFQLLTKRPENVEKMLPNDWGDKGYENVWLGATMEDQERYYHRWPILSRIPARVRFVSYEPAIGPLILDEEVVRPDWLISGGESGRGNRQMNPVWARSIRDQCQRLGVAYFHKQWGRIGANPFVVEGVMSRAQAMHADPKSNGKGGALLDGRLWREFPIT